MTAPDPAPLYQIGFAFMAAKVALCAVEFDLFTTLEDGPLTGEEIRTRLGLHPRAIPDFTDTLVALKLLDRDGDGPAARYRNTALASAHLDRNKPAYIGGLFAMFNRRLYGFWGQLDEALRTGEPQNETKQLGVSIFVKLYEDQAQLEGFINAMSGASHANFARLAEAFDFSRYGTLLDIGGASGLLCRLAARRHPDLRCTTVDLPKVTEIAAKAIVAEGLEDRVEARSLDFFSEPFPRADVITMGMILHDWNLENKRMLIGKAYDALPEGGTLIAVEHLIDDARRENLIGLLMSLNMLIEFGEAFDYTAADFNGWCRDAGFTRFETIHLRGATSAAIAYK